MLGNIFEYGLRVLRYAYVALRGILVLLLIVVAINAFAVTVFTVAGHSMDPTLKPGEFLIINRLAYTRAQPKVGDIVIADFGNERTGIRLVKRITALANQPAIMADGKRIMVKPGQLFLEGDNRTESTDSRTYGPVLESQIVGQVLWP